jgi:NitT/TauT family transport system substrate-binding protein
VRRRAFLQSGLALGAGVVGASIADACSGAPLSVGPTATLGPPETTSVRIASVPCDPALWTADDFLKEEGLSNAKIMLLPHGAVARGEGDIGVGYTQWIVASVDAGRPLQALGGLHTGCGEVWTKPEIASIGDLRGKTITVNSTDPVVDPWYGVWAAMFAYVGIDPRKDVNFAADPDANVITSFLDGKSDAVLALSTQVPMLRASPKNRGKLLIDMHVDGTWSKYYCCQLIVNRDWAKQNPNATKRVTRALLRANDRVARDPAAAALAGVKAGLYTPELYDTFLAAFRNSTFEWRDIDAEASLLFNAVQLSNLKLVKGTPKQLVAQASNLGYLAELKSQYPRAN